MSKVIGRFAPSPSGPLHLGSLMSAVCSYLQAKSQQGQWLVRIEDIDTPRVVKGVADQQLRQLDHYGFEWDRDIIYQSKRLDLYQSYLDQLITQNKIYACECSRKNLKKTAQSSSIGLIYPKTCLDKNLTLINHSLRLKTSESGIKFNDEIYGEQNFNIKNLSSDWVIKRADSIFSYHLAVVVDDYEQDISEVVRGVDILPLTVLHFDLRSKLKLKHPTYLHHSLMTKNQQKLSKQFGAQPIPEYNRIEALNLILRALGQVQILGISKLDEFWDIAIKQWDSNKITINNFEVI